MTVTKLYEAVKILIGRQPAQYGWPEALDPDARLT